MGIQTGFAHMPGRRFRLSCTRPLLRQHYHSKAPHMRLVYVCGVDQLDPEKNGSELAAGGCEVIAISRAGMQTIYAEQPNVQLIDDKEQLRYYSLSSTQFRTACSTKGGA